LLRSGPTAKKKPLGKFEYHMMHCAHPTCALCCTLFWRSSQMRALAILALALSLAGCTSDRLQDGMNLQQPALRRLVILTA
jgi:hypothetical protein